MISTKIFYSYIYSLYFCLRYLPFSQAKKIPILIHPGVHVQKLHKGDIIIKGKIWRAMIAIGFDGTIGRSSRKTLIYVIPGGHIIFRGYTCISKGCRMVINQGNLTFGAKNTINGDCFFSCYDNITLGNDIMCGWNVSFLTTNGHKIIINDELKPMTASINIGNHVWIGSDSVIGKGVSILNNCVIAHHSIVTKEMDEDSILIGGFPAKKIKSNVNWKP